MNTKKHRLKVSESIRIYLWFSIALVLVGCKPEEPKTFPKDRLTVEYSVDRESIQVGDPVELIVTAYFPTNGTVELPEIGRAKEVVLLKHDSAPIPREDGLTQSESRYSITSFRIGEHIVSTGQISSVVGDQTFTTNFPQIVLTVGTSLQSDDSSAIADIKSPHKLPGRIPAWVWIIPAIAAIAFLVGLISSKLWKNRAQIIPSAPPIPAHVLALRALEILKAKDLLEKDEYKPYYTELSLILRTYLEGRFALNAPDKTTEEVVEEMSRSIELNGAQHNILQDFMRQADEVKFAKGHPDRSTMEAAFNTTHQFVQETMQTNELAAKDRRELKGEEG